MNRLVDTGEAGRPKRRQNRPPERLSSGPTVVATQGEAHPGAGRGLPGGGDWVTGVGPSGGEELPCRVSVVCPEQVRASHRTKQEGAAPGVRTGAGGWGFT